MLFPLLEHSRRLIYTSSLPSQFLTMTSKEILETCKGLKIKKAFPGISPNFKTPLPPEIRDSLLPHLNSYSIQDLQVICSGLYTCCFSLQSKEHGILASKLISSLLSRKEKDVKGHQRSIVDILKFLASFSNLEAKCVRELCSHFNDGRKNTTLRLIHLWPRTKSDSQKEAVPIIRSLISQLPYSQFRMKDFEILLQDLFYFRIEPSSELLAAIKVSLSKPEKDFHSGRSRISLLKHLLYFGHMVIPSLNQVFEAFNSLESVTNINYKVLVELIVQLGTTNPLIPSSFFSSTSSKTERLYRNTIVSISEIDYLIGFQIRDSSSYSGTRLSPKIRKTLLTFSYPENEESSTSRLKRKLFHYATRVLTQSVTYVSLLPYSSSKDILISETIAVLIGKDKYVDRVGKHLGHLSQQIKILEQLGYYVIVLFPPSTGNIESQLMERIKEKMKDIHYY